MPTTPLPHSAYHTTEQILTSSATFSYSPVPLDSSLKVLPRSIGRSCRNEKVEISLLIEPELDREYESLSIKGAVIWVGLRSSEENFFEFSPTHSGWYGNDCYVSFLWRRKAIRQSLTFYTLSRFYPIKHIPCPYTCGYLCKFIVLRIQ